MKRTEKITMTVEELENLILEALMVSPDIGGDVEIRVGGETLQRLDGYDMGVEITVETEL
jgi:hypothetical protein